MNSYLKRDFLIITSVVIKEIKINKKKIVNPVRLYKDAMKTIKNFLIISNYANSTNNLIHDIRLMIASIHSIQ